MAVKEDHLPVDVVQIRRQTNDLGSHVTVSFGICVGDNYCVPIDHVVRLSRLRLWGLNAIEAVVRRFGAAPNRRSASLNGRRFQRLSTQRSLRWIARQLGRSAPTISREVSP